MTFYHNFMPLTLFQMLAIISTPIANLVKLNEISPNEQPEMKEILITEKNLLSTTGKVDRDPISDDIDSSE